MAEPSCGTVLNSTDAGMHLASADLRAGVAERSVAKGSMTKGTPRGYRGVPIDALGIYHAVYRYRIGCFRAGQAIAA